MAGLFRQATEEGLRFNRELLFSEFLPLWPNAHEALYAELGTSGFLQWLR